MYDYVVVGAGSSGCVLAARLSGDPDVNVLLLEAGGSDRHWSFRMPAALTMNLGKQHCDWCYHTTPQPRMNHRRLFWPRGKVLGGSSSLNAMAYVRGHPLDYERWVTEGASGWSYPEVLPYFRRAESWDSGSNEYRGGSGPLQVHRGNIDNPLFEAFIQAGEEAGFPVTEDMNGYQQEGFGRMDLTTGGGERSSTSRAYLYPVMDRPNLTVMTGAMVSSVLFHKQQATGVEYVQAGKKQIARAEREVILAGGAINSPQLLMLSGIGSAEQLRPLGIPVITDLPGVGRNLQDHLELYIQQECKQPVTLKKVANPMMKLGIGLKWFACHSGWGSSSHLEAGGFVCSRPDIPHPDIQFHFLPGMITNHGRSVGEHHAFQVHAGTMRSKSRGVLQLQSSDFMQPPMIEPRYLSDSDDLPELRRCIEISREVMSQPALSPFAGKELLPGGQCQTVAAMNDFIRQYAESAYHPCGTCRMGKTEDRDTVVDPQGRVVGVECLRVVDASIMPSIISGNLNATVIMMAERCSDLIAGKALLPASEVPSYYQNSCQTLSEPLQAEAGVRTET